MITNKVDPDPGSVERMEMFARLHTSAMYLALNEQLHLQGKSLAVMLLADNVRENELCVLDPRTAIPSNISTGDVFALTLVCHIRDSWQQVGKKSFVLYNASIGGEVVGGVPQGDRILMEHANILAPLLFYPIRVLNLKCEN